MSQLRFFDVFVGMCSCVANNNYFVYRHNEVDVESFHGGSVDNSLEEGSSTERREGRQLRKRHPPTAVTSGDEVNNGN